MNPSQGNVPISQVSRYFNELEELCNQGISDKDKENKINELFANHSESLVADLIANQSSIRRFNVISRSLQQTKISSDLLATVHHIKMAAFHLQHHDIRALTSSQTQTEQNKDIKIPSFLQNLSRFKLPDNLNEIRAITEPNLRAYVFAAIINKDKTPLNHINLTKNEIIQIGPHLTYLDSTDIFNEEWSTNEIHSFLDTCERLKYLRINSDKITRLMPLPFCKYINCSSCSSLRNLPTLPSCKELACSECSLLESLPNLDICERLSCEGCSSLRNLPNLPVCTKLICFNCTSLTEIPELPECKKINCCGCSRLNRMNAIPACRVLDCRQCISLRELPPLPLCRELHCYGCMILEMLPRLPSCEVLSYEECPALDINSVPIIFTRDQAEIPISGNFTVRVSELHEDPLGVLLKLEHPLLVERIIPQIQFIETDGRVTEAIDAGGVFRVFVSRLMKSLISHANQPKQLNFKETETGLYLPVFDLDKDDEIQLKGFKLIGTVLELCYIKSFTDNYVTTGLIFDQKLFDCITSLSFEELDVLDLMSPTLPDILKLKLMNSFAEINLRKIIKLLFIPPKELDLEQYNKLKEIVLSNRDEEEKLPFDINSDIPTEAEFDELKIWVQAWVKDFFLKQEDDVEQWLPALTIAKQMHQLVGIKNKWEELCALDAAALDEKIQGTIDRHLILSSITWITENRNLDALKVQATKNFVTQWLNEASSQDIQNLNNFITGSPTINPTKNLLFQLYDVSPSHLPNTHSCSFTIDLSINYGEYKDFKAKLELALASVNSTEISNLETT